MNFESEVREAFPELAEIADEDLREKVVEVYVNGLEESDHESLHDVPFAPKYNDILGDQTYVSHVRDGATTALAVTDSLLDRFEDIDIDRDAVVAGILLHDVSKIFEYHPISSGKTDRTRIGEFHGHPHYAQGMLDAVDMPLGVQHIVLSHTNSSAVDFKTMEAVIVAFSDLLGAHALFWAAADRLKPLQPHNF